MSQAERSPTPGLNYYWNGSEWIHYVSSTTTPLNSRAIQVDFSDAPTPPGFCEVAAPADLVDASKALGLTSYVFTFDDHASAARGTLQDLTAQLRESKPGDDHSMCVRKFCVELAAVWQRGYQPPDDLVGALLGLLHETIDFNRDPKTGTYGWCAKASVSNMSTFVYISAVAITYPTDDLLAVVRQLIRHTGLDKNLADLVKMATDKLGLPSDTAFPFESLLQEPVMQIVWEHCKEDDPTAPHKLFAAFAGPGCLRFA